MGLNVMGCSLKQPNSAIMISHFSCVELWLLLMGHKNEDSERLKASLIDILENNIHVMEFKKLDESVTKKRKKKKE